MKKLNGLTKISILTLLLAFVIPSWSIYGMVQDGNGFDQLKDAQQTVNASIDPVTSQGVNQTEQLEPMPQLLNDLLKHSNIIASHINNHIIDEAGVEDYIKHQINIYDVNRLTRTSWCLTPYINDLILDRFPFGVYWRS